MEKDDGGSAFPNDIGPMDSRFGMSLRDWFAGQALAGSVHSYRSGEGEDNQSQLAASCYTYADAMLAVRAATSR